MSVNINPITVYGLTQPLPTLTPDPIVSNRNPSTSDLAQIGQLWVNSGSNAYWILTSVTANSANWAAQSTSAATVANLEITGGAGTVLTVDAGGNTSLGGDLAVAGDTAMTGDLDVDGTFTANGAFDITSAAAVAITTTDNVIDALLLSTNGGTTETMRLVVNQGTAASSVDIASVNGGVYIAADNSTSNKAVNIVATSGGVQFDAVLTSAWNVVGAGQDIQLNATGGSVAVTATEATAGAITISASDAAGTLILQGVGGATLEATDNTVSIQSGTGATNIATAAAANTTTIGNGTAGSSVVINAGTAGVSVGANAIAHTVAIGNATGASQVNIQAGTAGAGQINIGATAHGVPIVIGNTTAATTLALTTPTGTNVVAANGVSITTAGRGVSLPGGLLVISVTGSPSGVITAPIGSLALRTDPAGATSRLYINTDAGTTWTNITCAA